VSIVAISASILARDAPRKWTATWDFFYTLQARRENITELAYSSLAVSGAMEHAFLTDLTMTK